MSVRKAAFPCPLAPRLAPCLALALALALGCNRPKLDRTRTIEVTPEKAAAAAGYQPPKVKVILRAGGEGVVLVDGQNVAPGCHTKGPGVALPSESGSANMATWRSCLESLKASFPGLASQRSIVLSPDTSTPYATVIALMDATRSTQDGKDLFPDVVFDNPPADH